MIEADLTLLDCIKNPVDYLDFEKWMHKEAWGKTVLYDFNLTVQYATATSSIEFTVANCDCAEEFIAFIQKHDVFFENLHVQVCDDVSSYLMTYLHSYTLKT